MKLTIKEIQNIKENIIKNFDKKAEQLNINSPFLKGFLKGVIDGFVNEIKKEENKKCNHKQKYILFFEYLEEIVEDFINCTNKSYNDVTLIYFLNWCFLQTKDKNHEK